LKSQQTTFKCKFTDHEHNQDMPAEIESCAKPDDKSKALSHKSRNWRWCDKRSKWVTHEEHDDDCVPNWKKKAESAQPAQKKQKSDNKVKKK